MTFSIPESETNVYGCLTSLNLEFTINEDIPGSNYVIRVYRPDYILQAILIADQSPGVHTTEPISIYSYITIQLVKITALGSEMVYELAFAYYSY